MNKASVGTKVYYTIIGLALAVIMAFSLVQQFGTPARAETPTVVTP